MAMVDADMISKAIWVHGTWRQKLRQAIDIGHSHLVVEQVAADRECEFGAWLHGLPADERDSEHWRLVHDLHAQFHVEAARVLALALNGKHAEAETAFHRGSEFRRRAAALTEALAHWKHALTTTR
jgi:hypothetical protein